MIRGPNGSKEQKYLIKDFRVLSRFYECVNCANSIHAQFAIGRNPLGGSNKMQLRYLWQTINTRKQHTQHMTCIGNQRLYGAIDIWAIYLSALTRTAMRNALICNSIEKLINCYCNGNGNCNCECEWECNFYWGNRPPQVVWLSTPNDSCAIYFRCNLGQVSATDTGINQSTTRDLSRYGRANTKLAVISTVIYTRNKSFTYFC